MCFIQLLWRVQLFFIYVGNFLLTQKFFNWKGCDARLGVSYSQKSCSKHSFSNLANGRTFQLVSQILNRVPKCKNSEKNKHKKQYSFKRKQERKSLKWT